MQPLMIRISAELIVGVLYWIRQVRGTVKDDVRASAFSIGPFKWLP